MKIEGLVGDRRCLRTEAFDSGEHDVDPNIPFKPSILSRQGNTDIGNGCGAAVRVSFVRDGASGGVRFRTAKARRNQAIFMVAELKRE